MSRPRPDGESSVGLDFGTTTTLVATPEGVVPIGASTGFIPSLAGYGDDGSVVVAEQAADLPPEQVVRSVKRSITERREYVRVDTPTGIRDVNADDLIADVLREAARRAKERGHDLTRKGALWLGCPAMWDGRQRRRLLAAAQRAELAVTMENLVDEPVAAGIAWLAGHGRTSDVPAQRVVVFDMGGGTLDVAVLHVGGERRRDVSVLAALSVPEAGDALDEAIAVDLDYALGSAGVDVDSLSDPARARARLAYEARTAKESLSATAEHFVSLPRRLFGISDFTYTRDRLNEAFTPQMQRAEGFVAAALRAARLTEDVNATAYDIARTPWEQLASTVDVVVLSGGMGQIPYVAQRLRTLFPDATRIEFAAAEPVSAVARGLALASGFGRINMYRPAFDILVEWDRGREFRTIYDAFTPLVEPWQIARGGGELRYVRDGLELDLPRRGKGRLRVVSHNGERVRASLGGESLDGFAVALNEQRFEFAIYPNGRIRLTDAVGAFDGYIADWHTLSGTDPSGTAYRDRDRDLAVTCGADWA